MAGNSQNPAFWLTLIVRPNVAPALTLFLSSISAFPGVLSDHATYTLLLEIIGSRLLNNEWMNVSYLSTDHRPLLQEELESVSLLKGVILQEAGLT
jgi:hypothetical protein